MGEPRKTDSTQKGNKRKRKAPAVAAINCFYTPILATSSVIKPNFREPRLLSACPRRRAPNSCCFSRPRSRRDPRALASLELLSHAGTPLANWPTATAGTFHGNSRVYVADIVPCPARKRTGVPKRERCPASQPVTAENKGVPERMTSAKSAPRSALPISFLYRLGFSRPSPHASLSR